MSRLRPKRLAGDGFQQSRQRPYFEQASCTTRYRVRDFARLSGLAWRNPLAAKSNVTGRTLVPGSASAALLDSTTDRRHPGTFFNARHKADGLVPRNAAARRRLTGLPSALSRPPSASCRRTCAGSSDDRRPRPGASRSSPSTPSVSKRDSHNRTVGRDTPTFAAMSCSRMPSIASSTMLLRRTTR